MPIVKVIVDEVSACIEPDDRDVCGVYSCDVDPALDRSLWADAALDCFHCHIGIKCLDDFAVRVVDQSGAELFPVDEVDPYQLDGRAVFLGQV